jgi:hypothetical protein
MATRFYIMPNTSEKKSKTFNNFPLPMVLISNLLSVFIYVLGAFVLAKFGLIWAAVYLLYCLAMEANLFRRSCVHCWYYGKLCGLGKGKLCAKFFKKGHPEKFGKEGAGLLKLIPDFLVFIIPLAGGGILLIMDFSWGLLGILGLLLVLATVGNGVVRGQLVCKYCRQRLITCPAEKFFNRKKS